jgi:hypothetical protein
MAIRMNSKCFVVATQDTLELDGPRPESCAINMAVRAISAMGVRLAAVGKPLLRRSDPAQRSPFLDTEAACWRR